MNEFLQGILSQLNAIFDPQMLGEQFAAILANVIVGIIVFTVFYIVWRIVKLFLQPTFDRANIDETAATFAERIIKYGILTLGAVQSLDAAGIRTSTLLASLGIASLTIGFAARDALSNLISGILIFFDRPFVIGDLVEIEGKYGRVEQITLRSTRIVTTDGKMLAVPNSEIINKTVASYTNYPHLRLDIAVTVAVTENIERARRVLLDIVHKDSDFMTTPAPRVVVTELNDYNVMLEVQAWIRNERIHIEKRFALRERIFDALNEAGIEMPFETIELLPLSVELQTMNDK